MERHNVSISGAGKITGGEYGDVRIAGSGRVEGDVTAEELCISGSGRVQGNAKAREITVSGSAKFAGRVEADVLETSGSCGIDGDAEVKEFRCSGSQRVGGKLRAHYVRASGSLQVGQDVEADVFTASGKFEIGGLLSADRVEVKLVGNSRAREIGGERIEVHTGSGFSLGINLAGLRLGRFATGSLTAETIEGDEVDLEATAAQIVRGKNVRIGPGCEIGTVEYSQSLQVHEEATVRNRVKV
ncbi:polymer-forming cytoskeletal protein [Candidatus Bipolaricaulota bacterium]|nr:polymer-forming cytoskeletal protein [Candidatus Bipolaricaulota bacterium]